MINFIPIFPLNIVVYPGERLNLHIFEEKYKQLITECFAEAKPFGIPTVLNEKIAETGTLVQITEIVKIYEEGKMDIKTEGTTIFKIFEVIKEVPEKLYGGAIVNYPENDTSHQLVLMPRIAKTLRELHKMLKIDKDFKKNEEELLSYDVAHHAAMSLQQEYELLCLLREDQRLEYLKRHFAKIIPIITHTESLKEKIKLNGHFKELKGLF